MGKCNKDSCTFQPVFFGQFRKALGNESGDQKGGQARQHSKGAGRDGPKGARGGKGKEKGKGKGKSKFKGDVALASNVEDRLYMSCTSTTVEAKVVL